MPVLNYMCIPVGASLILNFHLMEALMKFILRWLISEGSYSVTSCVLVHFKGAHAQTAGYSISHPSVKRERYRGKEREGIWMRQLMFSNAMLYLRLLTRWLIRQCGRHAPSCIWWLVIILSITCCDISQVVMPTLLCIIDLRCSLLLSRQVHEKVTWWCWVSLSLLPLNGALEPPLLFGRLCVFVCVSLTVHVTIALPSLA